MNVKTILLALMLLVLNGCATFEQAMGINQNEGNGYRIDHIEKSYAVTIEYEHFDFLMERSNREAELSFSTPQRPSFDGGQIVVKIESFSLESARASNWETIIFQDGEEISRTVGRSSTPNFYRSGGQTFWYSSMVVGLDKPVEDGYIDIYVVSPIQDRRDHFRLFGNN